MREVEVGAEVHGHRLLEKIGEGPYGEVWRAEFLGQTVALKLFGGARRPVEVRREALAQYVLGRLPGGEGRSFPRVEHIDLHADPPYIRMEFIDGTPLEDLLGNPSLPLDGRLGIGQRILEALAAVHRHGFVHGDLSPLNVMVTPDRGVRLIDVGYGALFDEDASDIAVSTTKEDRPRGVASPLYAAPERFRGAAAGGCGKPADLFSFGKVLYRLITGEQPFVIKPVSLRFPALGGEWDDFVFRCLEERPEARFPDAEVALEEYRRIWKPRPAAGEYRAECPECKAAQSIPGGWAGERFACQGCGRMLEVLFYDDAPRYATTALVEGTPSAEAPPIVFLEKETGGRVRKFCPSCGGEVRVEAKKCRHCGAWTDEEARRLAAARPGPRAEIPSYRVAAFITLAAYFLFWIPGMVLNWYFLGEAREAERRWKQTPPGMLALQVLVWLFVYIPLLALAGVLLLGVLAAALAAMLA